MNARRVVLAGVAAFVVTMAIGFAANEAFIGDVYVEYATAAMRPREDRLTRLPYVFTVLLRGQIAFAYIYARGCPLRSGITEGVKLGLAAAVTASLSSHVVQWDLYPIGGAIPAVVIPWEFAMWAVSGAVVYEPRRQVNSRR
jgi:hypothetical protein